MFPKAGFARCVQAGYGCRHQAVVNAIRSTTKFYGIHSFIPKHTELPLPDKEKGGPDIIVLADMTYAVDVTITATATPKTTGEITRAMLSERFKWKMKKYEAFAAMTGYVTIPFVMSIHALVCKETRDMVERWKVRATEPAFINALYANCQMAMIKAQYEMVRYTTSKHITQLEHRRWEQRQLTQPRRERDFESP